MLLQNGAIVLQRLYFCVEFCSRDGVDAQNGKKRATTLYMNSVKFISLAACNFNVVGFISLQNTFCNFRHLGFT